jgi:murein DD-endopeptidase MepM/ murein hydrolase activator NlpD
MSDKKHTGRGIFGKGYYIALILCAAAIGITGYLYYRNANDQDTQLQEPPAEQTVAATYGNEDVAVLATQPQEETPTVPTTATLPTEKRPLKTTSPVSGETVAGYSMEALSYNETTRDWRVHNGIDIAAEAGTPVVAAADGQVYTVYEDDTMGTTVVIRHEAGYTTKYSSLSDDLSVSAGDTVTMGQTIGTVGDSALVETVHGPHVHFSVTYQDAQMDPVEFLSLG